MIQGSVGNTVLQNYLDQKKTQANPNT